MKGGFWIILAMVALGALFAGVEKLEAGDGLTARFFFAFAFVLGVLSWAMYQEDREP